MAHGGDQETADRLLERLRKRFDVEWGFTIPFSVSTYLNSGPGAVGASLLALDDSRLATTTPIVKRMNQEIYVSTDVEADGPIPGPYSMLSFASAAYTADKKLIGTFEANLETLLGATAHPETAKWWQGQPEAWAACRENTEDPERAMTRYLTWLEELPGSPVFVGYPAAYDFLFVYWYLLKFTGKSPFSHSALDIKTLAMCLLGKGYRESTKRNMPKRWFDYLPHTHKALDDALEQGALFCNMLAEARKR